MKRALASTLVGTLICCAMSQPAMAGPDWFEPMGQDAGSLPKSAQPVNSSPTGVVRKISGSLTGTALQGGDFEDMYHFRILVPSQFCASTVECYNSEPYCGSAEFDTKLWLFDSTGRGLLGNDDTEQIIITEGSTTIVPGSTLSNAPCDGSIIVLPPGDYYLAITGANFPVSAGGTMFCFGDSKSNNCSDGPCSGDPDEVSGPDGPGGGSPIAGWTNNFDLPLKGSGPSGAYEIVFCIDSVGILTNGITLNADIKPGGCPNPFNRTSNGVLPVSLLGTATFDVNDIDKDSVRIGRNDDLFETIAPIEGPPGPHSVYDDNGTPFTGADCACHALGSDGHVDLSMKFNSTALVTALHLNDFPAGALVPLKITGELNDGTAFVARDCIRLVPPGTPPGMISVKQMSPHNYVEVSPPDLNLDTGGFGNFLRDFPITTVVTLNATPVTANHIFVGWKVDNGSQLIHSPNLTLTVTSATHIYEALYVELNEHDG